MAFRLLIVLMIFSACSNARADQANDFAAVVVKHESLSPYQTPFRITNPCMKKWVSLFDDTLRIELDPNFKKPIGRENFLYLKNKEDLIPAIVEQFRRYAFRNPEITIGGAIRVFDQTGAEGKIKFIENNGFSQKTKLIELYKGE